MQTRDSHIGRWNARECNRSHCKTSRLEAEQIKVVRCRCRAFFKHGNVISDRIGVRNGRGLGIKRAEVRRVILFLFRPSEHRRELSVKREEVRLEMRRTKKREKRITKNCLNCYLNQFSERDSFRNFTNFLQEISLFSREKKKEHTSICVHNMEMKERIFTKWVNQSSYQQVWIISE